MLRASMLDDFFLGDPDADIWLDAEGMPYWWMPDAFAVHEGCQMTLYRAKLII